MANHGFPEILLLVVTDYLHGKLSALMVLKQEHYHAALLDGSRLVNPRTSLDLAFDILRLA
jgi:hypothetical protein